MKRTKIRIVVAISALTLAMFGAATTATADNVQNTFEATLAPLNDSGVNGTASVEVTGNKLDVTFEATGLLMDAPHAAHIHFGEEASHECPPQSADMGDGQLSTSDGLPFYGPVVVSLTNTGDTSPASTLAIDRFSDAPDGTISYDRERIKTDRDVAMAIERGEAVVVLHGVDYNGNGVYDFGPGVSDLDSALPAEATDVAACGVLTGADVDGPPFPGGRNK